MISAQDRLRAAALDAADRAAVGWTTEAIVADRMEAWLQEQLSRCSDRAWGERFAHHCPVPGATPDDYLQRIVSVGEGLALIGIRMCGGDTAHPFVDVVLTAGGIALRAAVDAALDELSIFSPRRARVRSGGAEPPGEGGLSWALDQWVLAAPLSQIGSPGAGVRLEPIRDAAEGIRFVRGGYEAWAQRRGWLRSRVVPIGLASMQACQAAGAALWIVSEGERVGVICADRCVDREWAGWCMIEELVLPQHAGRRLASSAQGALAAHLLRLPADGPAPPCLFGTIDEANRPSLATAQRAGRSRVGALWWTWPEGDGPGPLPSAPW